MPVHISRSLLIILLFFSSCAVIKTPAALPVKTRPVYRIDPEPARIVVLHTCNVAASRYRKNKKALFSRFLDSVVVTAATEITERTGIPVDTVRGFTLLAGNGDSTIKSLMKKHSATHAIVLDSFTVYFDRTGVEVTKSNSGTSREAFYDIVSELGFSLYNDSGLFKQLLLKEKQYHSSRSVVSGLFAAGPNVVVQRRDAWRITGTNLVNYLNLFFESR